MEEQNRMDIRRLLKRFGVKADELIIAHMARYPDAVPLTLRVTLTDVTDYGDAPPDTPLYLEVEDTVGAQ